MSSKENSINILVSDQEFNMLICGVNSTIHQLEHNIYMDKLIRGACLDDDWKKEQLDLNKKFLEKLKIIISEFE